MVGNKKYKYFRDRALIIFPRIFLTINHIKWIETTKKNIGIYILRLNNNTTVEGKQKTTNSRNRVDSWEFGFFFFIYIITSV